MCMWHHPRNNSSYMYYVHRCAVKNINSNNAVHIFNRHRSSGVCIQYNPHIVPLISSHQNHTSESYDQRCPNNELETTFPLQLAHPQVSENILIQVVSRWFSPGEHGLYLFPRHRDVLDTCFFLLFFWLGK